MNEELDIFKPVILIDTDEEDGAGAAPSSELIAG